MNADDEKLKLYYSSLFTAFMDNDLADFKRILSSAVKDRFQPNQWVDKQHMFLYDFLRRIYGDLAPAEINPLPFLDAVLSHCKDINKITTYAFKSKRYNALQLALTTPCSSLQRKADCIKLFLKHNADVNALSGKIINYHAETSLTPLFLAEEPEIIEILLNAGADVHFKTDNGCDVISNYLYQFCPLPDEKKSPEETRAQFRQMINSIELLLKYGASPNAETSASPLMVLSGLKKRIYNDFINNSYNESEDKRKSKEQYLKILDDMLAEIFDILIYAGADINYEDEYGNNVINECGSYSLLMKYKQYGVDIFHTNKYGDTLFTKLIQGTYNKFYSDTDKSKIIDELLQNGFPVDTPLIQNKTALFYTILHNDTDLTKKLISFGANIEHRDDFGATPVMESISPLIIIETTQNKNAGYMDILKECEKLNANFYVCDNTNQNLLHKWANSTTCVYNTLVRIRLKDYRERLNKKYKETCLNLLDYLAAGKGIDVNAQDIYGNTPATLLAQTIFSKSVKYIMPILLRLIELGADLQIKNQDGICALDCIPENKNKQLILKMMELDKHSKQMVNNALEEYVR